jgi:hypothetical protein
LGGKSRKVGKVSPRLTQTNKKFKRVTLATGHGIFYGERSGYITKGVLKKIKNIPSPKSSLAGNPRSTKTPINRRKVEKWAKYNKYGPISQRFPTASGGRGSVIGGFHH